jgi:diguanylate cyclase (GGDEF)-like protein
MLIFSWYFRWLYYIDVNNVYHRGPLYLVPVFITIGLIFIAAFITIKKRKNIERKSFISLVFFSVPPLICIILQIIFYGMSLILNSVVLSLFVVFLNIQNHNIYTDYLTGVYNRKKLDLYLKEKVDASTENKSFSAISIDLNDFKSINDNFGHDIGDNALTTSAELLKSCIRSNDFIARYGGDEFCIVLGISSRIDLERLICRINNSVNEYNENSNMPYKLGFSMGYAVYDYNSHMKMEEFIKEIDRLMYENKNANKGL